MSDQRADAIAGPLVAGGPTWLSIIQPHELPGSPFLPSLFRTINDAYRPHIEHFHRMGGDQTGDRLKSFDDLVATLNEDTESFTFVLIRDGSDDAIATVTCRRHLAVDKTIESVWIRQLEPEAGAHEWEMKLLAVDPTYQKQGLADFMLAAVEQEAIRRSKKLLAAQKFLSDPGQGLQETADSRCRVKMVIGTWKENTHQFYAKRGYKDEYEVRRCPGIDMFVIFMAKHLVDLPRNTPA